MPSHAFTLRVRCLPIVILCMALLMPAAPAGAVAVENQGDSAVVAAPAGADAQGVAVEAGADARAVADKADVEPRDSVSQYGITWTFAEKAPVGRFVNGDWYVVGPVTITKITPEPTYGEDGRNGSMVNMKPAERAAFDSRLGSRYHPELGAKLPLKLEPGDSLISTISVEKVRELPRMMRPDSTCHSPVKTAAVLTCLTEAAPADAFRPAYCDTENHIRLARNIRWKLLPSVEPVDVTKGGHKDDVLHRVRPASWDVTHLPILTRVFQRPWIDILYDGYASPVDNMPQYGREVARASGLAALVLCCDYSKEEKKPLLVNVMQVGIDLWGAVEAGHHGWPAHGGHGNGRKLPIVLAGYLLGDDDMMHPYRDHPDLELSEDQQTIYADEVAPGATGWTGAKVIYGGHVGKDGLEGKVGWGAYEHLHPRDWPAQIGESYRRCCTSIAFVGEALALKLMHAEDVWDHPAFFDYADRWMTEDDSEHVKIIKETRGWDFSADHLRQEKVWDPFVNAMWAKYRNNLPPNPRKSE